MIAEGAITEDSLRSSGPYQSASIGFPVMELRALGTGRAGDLGRRVRRLAGGTAQLGRRPAGRRRDRAIRRRDRCRHELGRHRRGLRRRHVRAQRSAGRSPASATACWCSPRWRPTTRAAASGRSRSTARSTPRCSGSGSTTSTSTRCTGPTTTCRWRRRGVRWPSWSRPARPATSASPTSTGELVERCQPIHPVASVQNELSLVTTNDVAKFLPWLAEQGIGYLAYSPLGSGLLAGHSDRRPALRRRRLAQRAGRVCERADGG